MTSVGRTPAQELTPHIDQESPRSDQVPVSFAGFGDLLCTDAFFQPQSSDLFYLLTYCA